MTLIGIDTSVIIGLLDSRDTWHRAALSLQEAIAAARLEPVYFDCVLAEAISTLTRRLRERQREAELPDLLDCLDADFPPESITWILPDVPHLYGQVLALIRSSAGELNFNDGLIALTCRERGVRALASFDEDFDSLPWLTRVSAFADVKMVLTAGDQPESNTDE